MSTEHSFDVAISWTGNRGTGTSGPRAFGRDHLVRSSGKPDIAGSAARTFHGDVDRWNPEELLVAALAQCHLLSYLYVAVRRGLVVTGYSDSPRGLLEVEPDGSGRFREVVLRPVVELGAGDPADAAAAHDEAARLCFIRNSVAFPVRHEPTLRVVTR